MLCVTWSALNAVYSIIVRVTLVVVTLTRRADDHVAAAVAMGTALKQSMKWRRRRSTVDSDHLRLNAINFVQVEVQRFLRTNTAVYVILL